MSTFFSWTTSTVLFLSGFFFLSNSSNLDRDSEDFRFRESEKTTHKYYVSVSNVKYSQKAEALQMTTRFFIDDLEDVLNARNEKQVELGVKKEIQEHTDAIQKYLALKLEVSIDNTESKPKLLGAEYEGDQIILYIEFPAVEKPTTIQMEFNAFYELFEEQKNLIHFKINGKRKTMVLERGKPSDRLKF